MPAPRCPRHPRGHVRPFRANGPLGPAVYLQCVPGNGDPAHLLGLRSEPTPPRPAPGQVRLAARVVRGTADEFGLTPSELAVLCSAANGLTASETAQQLVKGEATVKTQRRQILLKLGARNMAHAVCIAAEEGLITSAPEEQQHQGLPGSTLAGRRADGSVQRAA
jgi:DNA-binding CsgD family transcriptional regulator